MPPQNAGNTAIVAVSRPGAVLARRLASSLPDAELHLERRLAADSDDGANLYDLPLRPVLQNLFVNRDALVVFLPVGAAVRLLAPVFAGKKRDPAVVCVDDAGRFAISLLSGHIGGGDELARRVAEAIGAQPVITSASDALNVTAVDLVGRKYGWRIDASPTDLTRAAAAVVNGEPVALWLDPATGAGWPDDSLLSDNITPVNSLDDSAAAHYSAALVVSDRLVSPDTDRPLVIYRPPTLAVGIGCRRGVDAGHLQELLANTLQEHGLARQSIARIATVDLKADELGIIALADSLGVPLETYAAAELNAAAHREPQQSASPACELHRPTPSAANNLLGVFGVAEPAAMLATGASGVIVPRTKSDRATIAVARIPIKGQDATEVASVTTQEPETMLPGERLLAMGQREIDKGNLQQGAGLVWQATMAALAAAAKRHGMPCGNREEAVKVVNHLDDIAGPPPPGEIYTYRHLMAFSVADSYREESENQEEALNAPDARWEPEEYQKHFDSVRRFIKALNSGSMSNVTP